MEQRTKDYAGLLKDIRASEVKKVQVAVTDIDGILRGKFIHKDKFLKVAESGLHFCDVIFGWDSSDQRYQNSEKTGWNSGYPDARVMLDLGTCRSIPWSEATPFFIGDVETKDSEPHALCPRQLLKSVVDRVYKAGFLTKVGVEFEWFCFDQDQAQSVRPRPITIGMFGYSLLQIDAHRGLIGKLINQLDDFDVPLESFHASSGPGAFESAISSSDALEAADRAVLFKTAVKQIARQENVTASFMARWNRNYPGAGGHVHQSLLRADGKPAFYSKDDQFEMSSVFKSYVAGIMRCLPELIVLFAPTVNSYKRFTPGFGAPINTSWGIDNRSCALRVIPSGPQGTHLEVRAGGADVNPYLAIAACLAAGLYGIENNLRLDSKSVVVGSSYRRNDLKPFPRSLMDAVEVFASSELVRELFGREFVDHYVRTRTWEWQQFESAVTDWELSRYCEII